MPRKSQSSSCVGELLISKENYDRILMWAQSKKEINFICLGKGKTIENVYRLSNISCSPENFSCWNENESKQLIKEKKIPGQKVLAMGHSHPKKHHDQHPSLFDIKYIDNGAIELIAFPLKNEIKAWIIYKSLSKTLKNEIGLICGGE